MSAPEFSRVERLDAIGSEPREVTVSAKEAERAALASRFGLLAIDRLEGRFTVWQEAAGIGVRGRVTATVTQACSVTGDPVPAQVDEEVILRFVHPAGARAPAGDEDEHELAGEEIDTVEIEGGGIDLGETAAETMALALDPFPRAPRAAEVLREAGVISEEEARPANPFAALKAKLGGDA
ncbi:Uncharacterized ACR, COG1399 [Sphingomonas palmae]|uniref:Uncharacterized ACR, COG1399 n=1 Tax=Sphingomonas palmae TaxID=1855283 RepID=A0A1H7RQ01_9SPHN|nr:DUF177 domain-containing protein [Sphingomonas palmae]SEL62292.1 Uncharacterized ACR, COG1399 [Sphingomonas palmae]